MLRSDKTNHRECSPPSEKRVKLENSSKLNLCVKIRCMICTHKFTVSENSILLYYRATCLASQTLFYWRASRKMVVSCCQTTFFRCYLWRRKKRGLVWFTVASGAKTRYYRPDPFGSPGKNGTYRKST